MRRKRKMTTKNAMNSDREKLLYATKLLSKVCSNKVCPEFPFPFKNITIVRYWDRIHWLFFIYLFSLTCFILAMNST